MKFTSLAEYLEKLEKTSSRLAITEILADLFKKSTEAEIDKICYLVLGQLAPRYDNIVFNIAEKMMLRVIADAYNVDLENVLKLYKEKGDMGETASMFAQKYESQFQKSKLNVVDVYEMLLEIAKDSGADSVERKIGKTSELLQRLDPLSAKFVSRIPVGRLRLGFSDKTILDALSWMETGGKSKKSALESAYNILPDVGLLAKEVKVKGIEKASKNIKPNIGVPVLPMLAARLKSPTEMIEKMKRVLVEPKFDGLRIQIHYKRSLASSAGKKSGFEDGTNVKAFTRNLNETSWMFPELDDIGKFIKAKEVIFDSEAVGVDSELKKMANFQTTMTRRRKHDIAQTASKISITFEVFDMMYKDGKSLVETPYEKRREELAKTLKDGDFIKVVDYEKTESAERIAELMQMELGEGLEGIIVKKADSKYIAGRTGYRWVKMKEKEGQKAKLADTLDLVVMGYYSGRGKRTVFGMGGFLVGISDPTSRKASRGELLTITKIGTGLTDEQFRELKKRLLKLEVKNKPKEYGDVAKILIPDIWVTPSQVVEIAADDITKSPNHSSGFALRFPRLVKFRDDKDWTGATSLTEIKNLFKLQ